MTMKLKEITLFKELASGAAGEVDIVGVTSILVKSSAASFCGSQRCKSGWLRLCS